MDMMKEAIKEAMMKVQDALSELQEVVSGEEKTEMLTGKEEKEESDESKSKDKAPELEGKKGIQPDDGLDKGMVEGAMGLDMPHQSKESFAMKLKSKLGNKV